MERKREEDECRWIPADQIENVLDIINGILAVDFSLFTITNCYCLQIDVVSLIESYIACSELTQYCV